MRCPDCDDVLLPGSVRCTCGWERRLDAVNRTCLCGEQASAKLNGVWLCPACHVAKMPELTPEEREYGRESIKKILEGLRK